MEAGGWAPRPRDIGWDGTDWVMTTMVFGYAATGQVPAGRLTTTTLICIVNCEAKRSHGSPRDRAAADTRVAVSRFVNEVSSDLFTQLFTRPRSCSMPR